MSNRFYVPPFDQPQLRIDGAEANHILRVLRFGVGDSITLFDGTGFEHAATIVETHSKRVTVEVTQSVDVDREIPGEIVIASALPKGDRQKTLIEKLTEIGTHRFIPIGTEHSVVEPGKQHVEKFNRYVIEASKQCERNRLMKIDQPNNLQLLLQSFTSHTKFILHPGTNSACLVKSILPKANLIFFIGPEGGFSPAEIKLASDNNCANISLGRRILRIESAAISIASIASNLLESKS